jgi:hypothetical protein
MYRRRNDQTIRASIAWGVLGLRTAWRDMAVCILRTEIVAASIGATTSAGASQIEAFAPLSQSAATQGQANSHN